MIYDIYVYIYTHLNRWVFRSRFLLRLLEWPEATSALTQLGVDIFAVKEYSKLHGKDYWVS